MQFFDLNLDINDPVIRDAIKYGIDIDLLLSNLNLSVEERVIQHQKALDILLEIEKTGQNYYAKSK